MNAETPFGRVKLHFDHEYEGNAPVSTICFIHTGHCEKDNKGEPCRAKDGAVGKARCNTKLDTWNTSTGKKIAMERALQKLSQVMARKFRASVWESYHKN